MRTIIFIGILMLFMITLSFAGMLPPKNTATNTYCWDTNGSGTCDGGEDENMDGNCDVTDCQGRDGVDGQQGPPGPAGTSVTAGTRCDPGYSSTGVDDSLNATGCFKPQDKEAQWESW